MLDINLILQAGPIRMYLRGPREASHADCAVSPLPSPVFITHPMAGRRKMRTNMCGVDNTDFVGRGLAEESFSQLVASQRRRTACNYLPSRCMPKRQTTYRAPVKCSESQLPMFVNRAEICTILVPRD